MGHAGPTGASVTALDSYYALLAAGCLFEVMTNDDGDVVLGIKGEMTVKHQRAVERDPEGLVAVVLEHLADMVPRAGDATPARVCFVRAKDGLVARWKTERGDIKVGEVADPDKGRRKRRGEE